MIEHYNAFISYRHSDQDIKVARTIQSDLEHFHIPAKIRKATGRKKIDRIFLDKDELGAASNLSADIADALERAEHLIVICSTATKQSAWVPREIEYFLRNHTRRQITTVLVDGEPEDVIPEILKYEDRTLTDPNGNEYTAWVPLEPLSCDYRLPRKKAKKEELPRLASKLLGCSYDELMNRRRAYMIRRLTIAFSLILAGVLGFGAYLIYSRIKIRESLESSLRNQSIYLANESLYSLEEEQRILALQLALEALPKDEDDSRPVTPQAIRALTESTLAYTTRDGFDIQDIWSYRMPDLIYNNNCLLSPGGNALAAWDKLGNLRVWDTRTHAVIFSADRLKNAKGVVFLPNDRFMLTTSEGVSVYRIPDGTLVWEKKLEMDYNPVAENSVFSDDTLLLATADMKLHRLSLDDGSEKAVYELPSDDTGMMTTISQLQISPDEKRVAVRIYKDITAQNILIYDIEDGKTHTIDHNEYVSAFVWGDEAHLITASPVKIAGSNSTIGDVKYVQTDHVTLRCFDPGSASELWNYDFTCENVSIHNNFLVLPQNEAVAYYHANKAEIFKVSNGKRVASHNTNESIIMAQDPDGDGWPFYVTENGGLVFPSNTESVTIYRFFTERLNQVFYSVDSGFFTHPSSSAEILHYGLYVCDDEWNQLKSSGELTHPERSYMDDNVMAVLSYVTADGSAEEITNNETRQLILTIVNPSTGEQVYSMPLIDDGKSLQSHKLSFLGSEGMHFYMGYAPQLQGYRILDLDLDTGEITDFDIAEEEYASPDFCSFSKGKLYYCTKQSGSLQLCVYDIATKKTDEYKISDDPSKVTVRKAPVVIPIRNSVLLTADQDTILVDLNSGAIETLTLPESWVTMGFAYDPGKDMIALSSSNTIRLVSLKGGEDIEISCPVVPGGMCFYTDEEKDGKTVLLVSSSDGYLYRYNTETGELAGQSVLTISGTSMERADFTFDTERKLMYLQIGDLLDIFETDTWYEETSIERCLGHHGPTDRFYAYSHPNGKVYTLGYFRHYTIDDLISKAKTMLRDSEMPDELKEAYGIEVEEE